MLLPSLEIAAAALLIGAAVRERIRHAHDRVGWVEIAGGFMTLVEAVQRTRERHHLSFMVLSFIQPVILFAFGIFDVQLAALRYLEANDEAFIVRLRLLFRRRLRWRDARAFRFRGTTLEVETERGVRRFPLKNVIDFEPAKAWTIEQFVRRGVSLRSADVSSAGPAASSPPRTRDASVPAGGAAGAPDVLPAEELPRGDQ